MANDVRDLGCSHIYVFSPLGIASPSASDTLQISTYGWFEDVVLCGSTAQVALQGDEYVGLISRPASIISSATAMLSQIPYIGPFARATSIASNAVAGVAAIFGYTNIPNCKDVDAVVPMSGPHLATGQISVPYQKLTLDPKQELSIDSRLNSLAGQDEMALSSLITRTSYLCSFAWADTDATGDVIGNMRINPALMRSTAVDNTAQPAVQVGYTVDHTPMSYFAQLFTHWRGSVEVDVEVVCTKFHKGRVRFSWDPLGGNDQTVPAENTVYTTILDIGVSNFITLKIPYHQAMPFQRTRGITNENHSAGGVMAPHLDYDNGILSVSVLTPLTSPDAPVSLELLISVRAGSDMEFANPSSILADDNTISSPSIFELQGKDEVCIMPAPVVFGDETSHDDERYGLNFGERIVSLRQLLHRMSVYDIMPFNHKSFTKYGSFKKSFTRIPPMHGWDPSAKLTGKSVAQTVVDPTVGHRENYHFPRTHPITYVAECFGGYRGGVNFICNISCDLYPSIGHIQVSRMTNDNEADFKLGDFNATVLNTGTNGNTVLRYLNTSLSAGRSGAAFTNTMTNGSIMWNFPDMNGAIMCYPDSRHTLTGNANDLTVYQGCMLEMLVKQQTSTTVTDIGTITTYCGTGPDFNLLWFICCPTLYYGLVVASY